MEVFVLLNSLKGDIIYVMDHSQETVRKPDKCSSQQKNEVVLIEAHLRKTITTFTWVPKCLISVTHSDCATPTYNHSHQAVGKGVNNLPRVEELTQQCNFRAGNSWDDCIILQNQEANNDDYSTKQYERENRTGTHQQRKAF